MSREILLKNGLVDISTSRSSNAANPRLFGTVFSNLSYYGYVLSKEATAKLLKLDQKELADWWTSVEPVLKSITGANRNMAKYVVYKNFPKEVLDMTQGQYWFNQILMYVGLPNELFTESEQTRDQMFESVTLKVIHLAKRDSLRKIMDNLLALPAKWTDDQFTQVKELALKYTPNVTYVPFKENMVNLAIHYINNDIDVNLNSSMDVLRLAVGLSGGDVSLATNSKFKNFSRSNRRKLLSMLDRVSNLEEDVARDKERWSKLFKNLHPGDYLQFSNVNNVYHKLYNNDVQSYNSRVERLLLKNSPLVLQTLEARPGVYARRLHEVTNRFGGKAISSFLSVADKLSVSQLLKLRKYFQTINGRSHLTIAPQGKWTSLKILPNTKQLGPRLTMQIVNGIDAVLANKLKVVGKVNLDDSADLVKLQTSDSELSPYGRGTVFPIPDNIKFIRSASYWQCKRGGNVWFDNGWNFFDENWKSVGDCCWNVYSFPYMYYNGKTQNHAAIFSGDPTNSKEMQGKACQMIDLYPDKLIKAGARYGVWNILCFSRIPFDQSEDVFAALQWGEDAQKGKLFEPSRCQLSFPITGNNYAKYIAYVDFVERKLVYIDANLKANVSSARYNSSTLENVMPAFVEYLNTLPSVYDLFENAVQDTSGKIITYDDTNVDVTGEAYVFKPTNENSKFKQINLNELLAL